MTVLQRAIEIIKVELAYLESINRTEFGNGAHTAFKKSLSHIEQFLSAEEQQIRDAFIAGCDAEFAGDYGGVGKKKVKSYITNLKSK